MDRLVVLELEGDLQTLGFRVTLEMQLEDNLHPIKVKGHLPPNLDLATYLQHHWGENYRSLVAPWRIKGKKIIHKGSINKRIAECKESAIQLRDRFKAWLDSETFRSVDRRLREELNRDESIRFLIRTEDKHLQKLPWQEWDFFERYSKAEVAFSATEFEQPKKLQTTPLKEKVRILAILGNSNGINVEVDRRKLEALPNAEVEFLVEPERDSLNDRLWEQSWDILFFAGHSETDGETGRIYINQTDSLSVNELKYGLKKAIAGGLQLAIFNSCDGLGVAYELEQLHIPQIIVMREPVPDKVAQEFLNYFLRAFANGESLYLAQRQARERLQGLEHQFPCASWLPAIYQNPTAVPPDWYSLQGQIEEQASRTEALPAALSPSQFSFTTSLLSPLRQQWYTVFLASIAATLLVMGVRFLEILQPLELWAYDHLIRQRPLELIDERILVVEVTDEDVAKYQYPLEDAILAQLLEKLEQYQPRALGLDMHRYQPRGAGREQLISRFAKNQNFFTVCASASSDPNYAPPPEFLQKQLTKQLGFSDLVVDAFNRKNRDFRGDLVVGKHSEDSSRTVRRQFLSYDPSLSPTPSACSTPYSLSFQLAYKFLSKEGIKPLAVTRNEEWQFGTVVFKKLATRFGGYQSLDGKSSQIVLNYRSYQPGQRITLRQVLSGQIDPNRVKDRVVLIGYTASVARDDFETPYGQMTGIWIHAHMVSQMLSAVLDQRPFVWVLPQWGSFQWGDTLWVFAWSLAGGLLVLRLHSPLYLGLAGGTATLVLYQICLIILTHGGWMPIVPSTLALLLTGSILVVCRHQSLGLQKLAPAGSRLTSSPHS